MVKARLGHALDAAGLAVGSSDPTSDLNVVLQRFFFANYPTSELGTPTSLNMSIEGGEITLSATAEVETTFLKLINQDRIVVNAEAKVIRETKGLEVVLVLDNTGSMRRNGKIDALKIAAQDLIDILFGEEQEPEKLFVGLVPFVTTVNIGNSPQIQQFMRFPNPAHEYPTTVDTQWKGCVEGRNFPNDVQDIYIPGDPQRGEWSPYFWEAETYFRFDTSSTFCRNRWWRPSLNQSPIPGLPRPTGRSGDPPLRQRARRSRYLPQSRRDAQHDAGPQSSLSPAADLIDQPAHDPGGGDRGDDPVERQRDDGQCRCRMGLAGSIP